MDNILLLVDAANMVHAQKENGWNIDFVRVLDYAKDIGDIAFAFYFSPVPVNDEIRIRKYRNFRTMLITSGWKVIDRVPSSFHTSAEGVVSRVKNNLDIDIVVKMLTINPDEYERVMLFSGDQDFVPAIEHLRALGKNVSIYGNMVSTSYELINTATGFISLDSIREAIEKNRVVVDRVVEEVVE